MTEVLVAPGIEPLLVAGITARVPEDVWVSTNVPNPRPDKLIRIRRRGGPRTSLVIDNPLVLIEVWAVSDTDAESLANLTAGIIASLDGEIVNSHMILHAEILGGPSNDPDPDSATPRYTLTAELRTRANPA